jgi:hypothetical protein
MPQINAALGGKASLHAGAGSKGPARVIAASCFNRCICRIHWNGSCLTIWNGHVSEQ